MNRIFIPIPKTGTTSIYKMIEEFNLSVIPRPPREICRYPWHPTLDEFLRIQSINLSNSFIFSISRNPYERFVSSFFFLKQYSPKWSNIDCDFEKFVLHISDFEDRLSEDIVFLPQVKWLTLGEKVHVENNWKYEEVFFNDFTWRNFCLDCFKLPLEPIWTNKSNHLQWKDYYNERSLKVVYNLYEKDFDVFKYSSKVKI